MDGSREFICCELNTDIVVSNLSNPGVRFSFKTVDISRGGMRLALINKIKIGVCIK